MGLPLAILFQDGGGGGGAVAGALGGLCISLIGLAIAIAVIYGVWQGFEKAGKPGWHAIIPIFNAWTAAEISGKPGWYGLLLLISPLNLIFGFLIGQATAEVYGKPESSTLYGIIGALTGLLPFAIVGYGDAEYVGPSAGGMMGGPGAPAL